MASQLQPSASFNREQISSATGALRSALAALEPGAQITVAIVSAAFEAVERMSDVVPSGHSKMAAAFRHSQEEEYCQVLSSYRAALAEWNRQLPRIQGWLLTEKARLETRLGHAGSVRTWLDSNRQTR